MRQTKIVIHLVHRPLLPYAVLALTERVDPTSHRRYPLANIEVQPFDKRCIDLATTRCQHLLHPLHGAEHHPIRDAHDAPAPVRLHYLRVEQLGDRYPARFGQWTLLSAPCWLTPLAKMGQEGRAVVLE